MDPSREQPPSWNHHHQQHPQLLRQDHPRHHEPYPTTSSSQTLHYGHPHPRPHLPSAHPPGQSTHFGSHSPAQRPATSAGTSAPSFASGQSQHAAQTHAWHYQQEEHHRRQQATATPAQPFQQQQQQQQPQFHASHPPPQPRPTHAVSQPGHQYNHQLHHHQQQQLHYRPAASPVFQQATTTRFNGEPASPLPSFAHLPSGSTSSPAPHSVPRHDRPQRPAPSSGGQQPQSASSSRSTTVRGQNNSPRMTQVPTPARVVQAAASITALQPTTSRHEPYPRLRSPTQRPPLTPYPASPCIAADRDDHLPQYEPGSFPSEQPSIAQEGDRHRNRRSRESGSSQPRNRPGFQQSQSQPSRTSAHPVHHARYHQGPLGESVLPSRAPISVIYPEEDGGYGGGQGEEQDIIMEEPDPLEVTLNIDLPKTTRSGEGEPSTTVLNVNPSWHCVFVEAVQQERIRCWIRIQFCGSSRQLEQRSLVCQLQSLQVIGYQSRQVELTRRICGKNLLNKGGITSKYSVLHF